MHVRLLAATALAAITPVGAARRMDPNAAFTCANKLLGHGEYLKAADLLKTASGEEADPMGMLHQFAGQIVPFVSGEPTRSAVTPEAKADPAELRRLSKAELRNAIDVIVERARQTNIVILNEEHVAPRDRAFALEVARALRPLGYSILAAESFSSSADAVQREAKAQTLLSTGYPQLTTGIYVKDPVFGDFVRQSLALGYRPLAYEYVASKGSPPPADPISARDQGEAENLIRSVFSKLPGAKVLIYVGYEHAAEETSSDHEWLAARLKRMSGIDPLTIDQTTVSPSAFGESNRTLYAAVRPRLRGSVVPMLGGKPVTVGKMAGVVDLQVIHAPTHLVRGRPDWLQAMGRKPVEIPKALLPRTGRVLVQAFVAAEGPDAVPVDQAVVTAAHRAPVLMLPPRPIQFEVRTSYQPGDCPSA